MPNYDQILERISQLVEPHLGSGNVATYIPPLANVSPQHFGMALLTLDGVLHTTAEADIRFSAQSIAKVISFTMAMQLAGDSIWDRVGREPSGTAFNSLVQLESELGIPRNPMINAGALVMLDMILSERADADTRIAKFIAKLSPGIEVVYDDVVGRAERQTAFRNRALANYLKSFGNLSNDPDTVVDLHCRISSLSVSCIELCELMFFLASGGVNTKGDRVATSEEVKRINAVMLTCGVYDEAGDYAYRVGLPAKSGVGGGIVAVLPGEYVACVWSPALNETGNSFCGTMALELLTEATGRSIF